MMSRNPFFAAAICGIGILLSVLTGCVTVPVPATISRSSPPSSSPVPASTPKPDPANISPRLPAPIPAPAPVVAPAPTTPAPRAPAQGRENVWSLLERGEGNRARAYFLGETGVNDTDSRGRTALHYAAENRDAELAAFLISLGATVDAVDADGRTPLSISAEKLDPHTGGILAGKAADIHYTMKENSSPARIAVNENGEFLLALLNPVSLSSADSSGKSLLHIAAETGSAGAVDTILKAEKNLSRKDNSGKTALDLALERTDSRNHAEAAGRLILAGAVSANPLYAYFSPAVKTSNYNIRSSGGMAPLHYIAREGYTGYLAFLLEKEADVNIKNDSGATPLHEAARSGKIKIMETLLDNGADINIQDAKGNSALHIAVPPAAHPDAVKLLLEKKANPNLRDEHGDSPLHIIITLNRPEGILETLLAGGADVTIRDINGKTPLYLAVEKNRGKYIPPLLSRKSDIFAADNNGVTPYEKALLEQRAVLFSLITGETVFQNDSAGNTILHLTIAAGINGEVINTILNHGALVNARNKAGDTSLTVAVRENRQSSGEILLSRGADIFAVNAKGESPLYLSFPPPSSTAPGTLSAELRQWMLNPQTLGARDGLGNTALHYLAQWRYDSWIPLLIRQGANTEAANATGETPLFIAVKQNSPSTVYTLIENGASFNTRDTLGNSLLHAAVRWNAPQSAETLIDLGLDINCHALNGKTPLHDSIRLGLEDVEKLLIRRGADIEARDADGNTPFMEAVVAENQTIMKQLTGMGTNPDTRNFRGDTALHICAETGSVDTAKLLLDWGASILSKNALGRTPYQDVLVNSPGLLEIFLSKDRVLLTDENGSSLLHIAVQEQVSPAVVKTIIDLGARISLVDSEGRTPLRLAVDLNRWDTAKLLADSGADVFITARDGKTAAGISLEKGEEAAKALFSGAAINAKDSSGNTVLHYAARQGNPSVISTLLALGANREVKNIASESAADIALRWKHPDAAALLN